MLLNIISELLFQYSPILFCYIFLFSVHAYYLYFINHKIIR